MYFLGIDPGQSGGIAIVGELGHEPRSLALAMPKTERDICDCIEELRCKYKPYAMIEKVHAMPKNGKMALFKLGYNYGLLRATLIASQIPFDEVSPATWQKKLGCLSKGDKNVTKAKAQQLFPHLKITHAISDALLIAEYARITSNTDSWDRI